MTSRTDAGDAWPERAERDTLFRGKGVMRARCRDFDWSSTSLGSVVQWPQDLRTMVRTVLASRQPMLLLWGRDLVQIFNDAFAESLGEEPTGVSALGSRCAEYWQQSWAEIGGGILAVVDTGVAQLNRDWPHLVRREQGAQPWLRCGYTPVFASDDSVAGVLVICHDNTSQVAAERERDQRACSFEGHAGSRNGLAVAHHEARDAAAVEPDHRGRPVFLRIRGSRSLRARIDAGGI